MIRCNSGNLANDIINNIENALGVLLSTTSTSNSSLRTIMKSNNSYGSLNTSKLMNSDNTLASSMMDLNQSNNNNNSTSHSSTYTSFHHHLELHNNHHHHHHENNLIHYHHWMVMKFIMPIL